MRKVSVEVLEDASHPEGGFAVILLLGVQALPDGAEFRLKPVEARGAADNGFGSSWPQGEQRPRAVRGTEAGIELLIGPDIVESPALLPGTLGVIEIQSAGIRGEFLWPSIRPTARPRRRNLRVVRPQIVQADSGTGGGAGAHAHVHRVASSAAAAAAAGLDAASSHVGSSRLLQDGGAGGLAKEREPDFAPLAPVTALDHAVPASASVAEAVGGNVVRLNTVRETVGDGAEGDRGAVGPEGKAVEGPRALVANAGVPTSHSSGQRARLVAAVATVAMLVSGGWLLLQERLQTGGSADRPTPVVSQGQPQVVAVELVERVPAVASPAKVPGAGPTRQDADAAEAEPRPNAVETKSETAAALEPSAPAAPVPPPNLEVTLRMRGGGFQISGDLKGYDGAKYVIETKSAGVLTMDAARFECVGEPCSKPASVILALSERPSPVKPDLLRIEGAPSLGEAFIPRLIRDYALSIGATSFEVPLDGDAGAAAGAKRYRIVDTRSVELATIEVHSTGTAAGLSSLERGAAAIALIDRPSEAEVSQRVAPRARRRSAKPVALPPPASEIPIGLDAVAVIAAPQSSVVSLSLDNMAKVLAGQISDWYELGQAPGPIRVYLPPDGSGTMETFARLVMRPRGLDFSRSALRLSSDAKVSDAALQDPGAIALVSLAAQGGAKAVNLETSCGLVVRPTSFAVKTGEYPLIRRLSLQVAPQLGQPSARGLVRIAQSGEVQHALAAGRVIDPTIASLPIEEQAERMAWAANAPPAAFDAAEFRQLLADLVGASRLSVTFRFVPGTNELDQRSRTEVQRLAAALKEPELAGKRIILAGFTDATGRFAVNVAAASRRAGQVRSALLAAAGGFEPRLVQSKGYGPIAPVACNGTSEGARLNRRVEVWVAG